MLGLYLPPVFGVVTRPSIPAPNDHFTAGPHCRVTTSADGRVGDAGGCPTIRAGIVSPAGVQQCACHHTARPRRSFHCRSTLPCDRLGQRARWSCWWLSNYPCWDCISRRCSMTDCRCLHPRRSFHCRSRLPCDATRPRGALAVVVAVHVSSVHGTPRRQFSEECRQPALTLLPPTSHGARRSARIQRAEFDLAPKNRRLNALLILVWPNTRR